MRVTFVVVLDRMTDRAEVQRPARRFRPCREVTKSPYAAHLQDGERGGKRRLLGELRYPLATHPDESGEFGGSKESVHIAQSKHLHRLELV